MPPAPDPTAPSPPGWARSVFLRSIDSPDMRGAGRELLSLALIDARNRTLHLLSMCGDAADALWLAGHAGWFSEWWIARNTQRAFGIACSPRPTRLASIEPRADDWWAQRPDDAPRAFPSSSSEPWPDPDVTRAYLLETLENTLDMLDRAVETDAGLYFYRLALFHEDVCGEDLVVRAQTLGLPLDVPVGAPPLLRDAVPLPATAWALGRPDEGFAFAQECGIQETEVPAFEIDAQPVTWSQFAEFVDDGGYDRPELWRPEGAQWLARQVEGRRAPRHVEHIGVSRHGVGGAVMQRRFGRTVRLAGNRSAVHVTWWEADAWARWAGRRLATEVEWEIAASAPAHHGFRWGDVHEWTANTLRPWPGFRPDPWSAGTAFDPRPAFGQARVLRGASLATHARLRSAQRRGFALPEWDEGFVGFRTCAV